MLALLPACATVIGLLILQPVPTPTEIAGVALVVSAVALHRIPDTRALIARQGRGGSVTRPRRLGIQLRFSKPPRVRRRRW